MTWNLHGKHLNSLQGILDRTEDALDIVFLQELGGFARVPKRDTKSDSVNISGKTYLVLIYQTPLSHHAVAVLIRQQLALDVRHKHLFGTGMVVECVAQGRTLWFGTGHMPHQQRPDAEEAWLSSLAKLS